MAVKMRLMRMGKKKSASYRVVVIDGRAPRDGRYIDLIGRYDPNQDPSLVEIDTEKAVEWLRKGAQPTESVAKLLEISGAMARFKVAAGKIHTVAAKAAARPGAPTPMEEAPAPAEEVGVTSEVPSTEGAETAAEDEEPSGAKTQTTDEEE